METKTAKINSVQENQRQFEYQGAKYFEHWIKYEGSDIVHTYASKTEKCEKFKVGEIATFDVEVRQNGPHTNYKIKPKQDNPFKKSEPKDQGLITALSCISSAVQLHHRHSPNSAEGVIETANKFFEFAMSKSSLK